MAHTYLAHYRTIYASHNSTHKSRCEPSLHRLEPVTAQLAGNPKNAFKCQLILDRRELSKSRDLVGLARNSENIRDTLSGSSQCFHFNVDYFCSFVSSPWLCISLILIFNIRNVKIIKKIHRLSPRSGCPSVGHRLCQGFCLRSFKPGL